MQQASHQPTNCREATTDKRESRYTAVVTEIGHPYRCALCNSRQAPAAPAPSGLFSDKKLRIWPDNFRLARYLTITSGPLSARERG